MYKTTTRKKILSLCLLTLSQAGWAQTQTVQVLEFHPAPGQFVNVLPEADANSTQDEVNRRCEDLLNDEGNVVSLGTYGGYITMKFDHPIVNKHGSDFLILGNGMYATDDPKYGNETIGGSIEPGIVYVGVGDNLETANGMSWQARNTTPTRFTTSRSLTSSQPQKPVNISCLDLSATTISSGIVHGPTPRESDAIPLAIT